MENKEQKDRILFHIDCNAFYASVEETLYPELKDVPMAICGNPESRRGIILAKNQLAKGFGIKTAETIWQAKRKCPDLVLRPGRHHLYREICEEINAIYEQYTDRVERFGIDESYLDVTASIHLFGGNAVALANEIKNRVASETKVTVSVGISFNKIFAKLGSDMAGRNSITVITRDNYRDVVWPLPVSAFFMVGKSTEQALQRLYIQTIGDLARAKQPTLAKRLGKMGEVLHRNANGLDESPVARVGEQEPPHSIGNGITFKRNLVSLNDVQTAVTALADTVAARLRKAGMKCASLQVAIKDANLKVITRQKATAYPLWLAADIAEAAMEIIQSSWKIGTPIRLLALTGQKLVNADDAQEQLSFFIRDTDRREREKREKLEQAVDGIRDRFGKGSIYPGSVIKNDLGIHEEFGKEE